MFRASRNRQIKYLKDTFSKRSRPHGTFESNLSLIDIETKISKTLEESFDNDPLQISIVDTIDSETPGYILGSYAIKCINKKKLLCSKVEWAPRYVTITSQGNGMPIIPPLKEEELIGMPNRDFSMTITNDYKFRGQIHTEFGLEASSLWSENINLIYAGNGVTIAVLHLSQRFPRIYGVQSASILDETLYRVTNGRKELGLVDWVPSNVMVEKL